MEDVFFGAVTKARESAGAAYPWQGALDVQVDGQRDRHAGGGAVETLLGQAQTMLRDNRASSVRAAQTMLDSYAALASGILIGMSEGLQAGTRGRTSSDASGGGDASAPAPAPAAKRAPSGAAAKRSAR